MFEKIKKMVRDYKWKRKIRKKLGTDFEVISDFSRQGFNVRVLRKRVRPITYYYDAISLICNEEVIVQNANECRYKKCSEHLYIAIDGKVYCNKRGENKIEIILEVEGLRDLYENCNDNRIFLYYEDKICYHKMLYDIASKKKFIYDSLLSEEPLILERHYEEGYSYLIETPFGLTESEVFDYSVSKESIINSSCFLNRIVGHKAWQIMYFSETQFVFETEYSYDTARTLDEWEAPEYYTHIVTNGAITYLLRVDDLREEEILGNKIRRLDVNGKSFYKSFDENEVHLLYYNKEDNTFSIIATYEGDDLSLEEEPRFNTETGKFEQQLFVVKKTVTVKEASRNNMA